MWGIIAFISLLITIVFFLGSINPNLLNQKLKEGETPWTRKKAFITAVFSGTATLIFLGLSSEPAEKTTKPVTAQSTSNQTQPTMDEKTKADQEAKEKADEEAKTNNIDDFTPAQKPELKNVSKNMGLGDTFDYVKSQLGEPNQEVNKMSHGYGRYNYKNNLELIKYEYGRVTHLDFQLDTQNLQTDLSVAKKFSLNTLPADAVFVKEYDKDNSEKILVYKSNSLASLFPESRFENTDGDIHPGECDVVLIHHGGKVDALSVFLGDNP